MMFYLQPGTAKDEYLGVTFDEKEIEVIKLACTNTTSREEGRLDEAAAQGISTYALQVDRTNKAILISDLVIFFKPGQKVLIKESDLIPILLSLEKFRSSQARSIRMQLKAPYIRSIPALKKINGAGRL